MKHKNNIAMLSIIAMLLAATCAVGLHAAAKTPTSGAANLLSGAKTSGTLPAGTSTSTGGSAASILGTVTGLGAGAATGAASPISINPTLELGLNITDIKSTATADAMCASVSGEGATLINATEGSVVQVGGVTCNMEQTAESTVGTESTTSTSGKK